MSGIAGIIRFDGAPVEPGLVEQMTAAMPYRGPDGIHHWVKGSVAMGQCMLHTTPESLEEKQPLTNEDESLVLVMDGRVDNWEELRKELLGRSVMLRNRSDAELVMRSYETWGKDCLSHIDGDFAMVIWDARRQEVFCARDRMGNKPFNYHWDGKTLAFASELGVILALPWVSEIPNEGMLSEIISDEWYSRDETLWSGILRLVAGHQIVVGKHGPHLEQYWEPDFFETLPFRKDEEYFDYYRELLTDIIRRLSRSHRPVAYGVSGGLDSSAVFCLAAQLKDADKLPTPGINGHTLAYRGNSDADETVYVKALSDYLGIRVHEVTPSVMPLEWYSDRARKIRDCPGYPVGTGHRALAEQVSKMKGVALLTGAGGDHWLQGSRLYYAEELALRHWDKLSDCLRADAQAFGMGQAAWWFFRYGIVTLFPDAPKAAFRSLIQKIRTKTTRDASWLSPRLQTILAQRRSRFLSHQDMIPHSINKQNLLKTLYYAFDHYATELGERLCAESGVELRHPMRTSKFVQCAFSTPERLRLRGGQQKYIHVKALQKILPQAISQRKDKADFASVVNAYLDQMEDVYTETIPKNRVAWLDHQGMIRLFRLYKKQPELGWQNWALWGIYACDKVLP